MSEFFGLDQVTDISQLKSGMPIYVVHCLGKSSYVKKHIVGQPEVNIAPFGFRFIRTLVDRKITETGLNADIICKNLPNKAYFTLDSALAYLDNCKQCGSNMNRLIADFLS